MKGDFMADDTVVVQETVEKEYTLDQINADIATLQSNIAAAEAEITRLQTIKAQIEYPS